MNPWLLESFVVVLAQWWFPRYIFIFDNYEVLQESRLHNFQATQAHVYDQYVFDFKHGVSEGISCTSSLPFISHDISYTLSGLFQ